MKNDMVKITCNHKFFQEKKRTRKVVFEVLSDL